MQRNIISIHIFEKFFSNNIINNQLLILNIIEKKQEFLIIISNIINLYLVALKF